MGTSHSVEIPHLPKHLKVIMLNPESKIAKSQGVDIPVMYVYLAGRIAGNCIDQCLKWRHEIIDYYKDYKGRGAYPISFLCPLNSGEANSVDKLGLTSSIPPNLIYSKDLLSVERADVVICNMEDYFEEGIEEELGLKPILGENNIEVGWNKDYDYRKGFFNLRSKISNRRENFGTICEFAIALYLQKPIILLVPEKRKEIYEKHPFASRASVIVTSVEQLFEEKWLQILYKSISGATY